MKKMPTLFIKQFDENHNYLGVSNEVTPGYEWVLNGDGLATVKRDGSATAIIRGAFYRRYDAKNGKPAPKNGIPCQEEADPVTGHWPFWIPCDRNNPADQWYWKAYDVYKNWIGYPENGTYEAIGPHFQSNPYNLVNDVLIQHGCEPIYNIERSYEGIKKYLSENYIEGIVFWKDGSPQCKIRRSDFGLDWNAKRNNK